MFFPTDDDDAKPITWELCHRRQRQKTELSITREEPSLQTDGDENVKLEVDDFKGHKDKRTVLMCLTSATMLFPFGLKRCWELVTWQSTFMAYWCILTWLVSVLYWHKAGPSWRLDLDNFFAKLSFCVVAVFGAMYARDLGSAIFGWFIGIVIVLLYLASCRLFAARSNHWIIPHGLMHICVGSNMAICVWSGHRAIVTREVIDICSLGPIDDFFNSIGAICAHIIK